MPILLLRTASVLAAGFLLAGSSSKAPTTTSENTAAGGTVGRTAAFCPAPWTEDQLLVPPSSSLADLDSQNMSVATLSPADVWMLTTETDNRGNNVSAVYHLAGSQWRESAQLADSSGAFSAEWIVARSDTDVWAVGSARGGLAAWHYDGSSWTDHPPAQFSHATIDAAVLGRDGILYLAGTSGQTRKGIILRYDGLKWTDLSPANPPQEYEALAVTAGGTLIAGGGGRNDGTLQERSGTAWTTVSLSAPVAAITRVSTGPGGSVYGVGSAAGDQPVLIEQPPGSRSATVLDAPVAEPASTFTNKTNAVALGLDVWLLAGFGLHDAWRHLWTKHFDDNGLRAGRRAAQVRVGSPMAGLGADRPCWPTAAPGTSIANGSLPGSSRCDPCRRYFDLYRQQENSTGWSHRSAPATDC